MKTNPEIFDWSSALASVGGDRNFLSEVAGLFQAAWPTLLGNIRAGLATGDLWAVESSARLVEGAARNVSAKNVYESARQLEFLARQGAVRASQAACANLEHEVEALKPYLAPLRDPKDF